MKLTFDDKETQRYTRMRAGAAEFRYLAAEVKLATDHLPELTKAAQVAREAIPTILPSQLVAFGPEVRQARQRIQDAEFILGAVRSSESLVSSRLARLNAELVSAFKALQTALRWKVRDAFPTPGRNEAKLNTNSGIISPECSAAINRVVTIAGDTIADRAEALLALAVEYGLPKEAA